MSQNLLFMVFFGDYVTNNSENTNIGVSGLALVWCYASLGVVQLPFVETMTRGVSVFPFVLRSLASKKLPLVETMTTGVSGFAESRWLRAAWRRRARLEGRVAPGFFQLFFSQPPFIVFFPAQWQ